MLVAGCAGAEPPSVPKPAPPATMTSRPASSPAPASSTAEPAPPSAPVEADTPPGFTSRDIAALPSPDARAAKEDVPPGFTCRIGSDRLRPLSEHEALIFFSDKLYSGYLGGWRGFDVTSGAEVDAFTLGIVTQGLSPSGTCAAVLAGSSDGKDEVELYRMPARELVAKRKLPRDHSHGLVLADDCSSAMREDRYGSPCASLFGPGLAGTGQVCAGVRLDKSASSADGRRVALVPGEMAGNVYVGDGVHVFDTATREEIVFFKRRGERLGAVSLSRDGGLAAFVDGEEVRAVKVPSGEAVSTFAVPAGHGVRALVFSPSAKRLAVSLLRKDFQGYALAVVDVATGRPLFTQRGLPELGKVAFSPDGARVAYVAKTGVHIADTFTGEERVAAGRLVQVQGSALSGAGDRAVVSSAGHLTVWDTRDCSLVADLPNDPPLDHLLVLPGGAAVVGFADQVVYKVDLTTGTRVSAALGQMNARDSHAVAPDGKTAFVGLEDDRRKQRIVAVDLAAMKVKMRVTLPGVGPIQALVFTPDGKKLHAAAPGGFEHGDSPTGGTTVVEVDPASGASGRKIQLLGASQHSLGAVLEKGRVLTLNGWWLERATGKELPRVRRSLLAVSGDHRTALWSDEKGEFAWPVDDPLPETATAIPTSHGWPSVGREAVLRCGEQSCLVTRFAGR